MVSIMRTKFILVFVILCSVFKLNAAEVSIPEAISVSDGYQQIILQAKGSQIFLCVGEAGKYKWQWQAPEAILYEKKSRAVVGYHAAGPSWTFNDGSHVIASVVQKVDSPEKSAAPWLLLKVKQHSGSGILAQTLYIQRINTQGGIAPESGCNTNHLGSEKKVAYSSDYIFYRK